MEESIRGRAHDHFVFFIPHHRGELLSLRDIERLHKKPKSDKETRLATAMVSGGIPFPTLNRRWIEGVLIPSVCSYKLPGPCLPALPPSHPPFKGIINT